MSFLNIFVSSIYIYEEKRMKNISLNDAKSGFWFWLITAEPVEEWGLF